MASRAYSTGCAALRTLESGKIARPFAPIPNLRPWLESRVTQLLDEADRLIALLDTLDGDADREDLDTDLEQDADSEPGDDGEPSLGWTAREAACGAFALAVDIDLELDQVAP